MENNPESMANDILAFLKETPSAREDVFRHFDNSYITVFLDLIKYNCIKLEHDGKYRLNIEHFYKAEGFLKDYEPQKDAIDKSLYNLYNQMREDEVQHALVDREFLFYESIKSGDVDTVKMLFTPLGGKGYGVLSKDKLRNLKYHLVISIAIIARYCINAGMPMEESYHLSDVFIMKTDECQTVEEINKLHYEALIRYTLEMKQIINKNHYCKYVMMAVDYISDHLHDKISINEVSDYVGVSAHYFSKIFKNDTGVSFSEYVVQKKIEAAKKMIQYTDLSFIDMSNVLNFSSQSYFIKVFKKFTGMSPKEYKNRFYSNKHKFFT